MRNTPASIAAGRQMIDRTSRDKAVQLLKAILAGGISNYRFEDEWPDQSHDFAVRAVGEQLWFYYEDSPEKMLTRSSFEPAAIKLIERCIVFLTSDNEYEWPHYSFATENRRFLERLLGLGKKRSNEEWERFKAAGEIDAWPFLRVSDLQEAVSRVA
jgi:hypothetical protein